MIDEEKTEAELQNNGKVNDTNVEDVIMDGSAQKEHESIPTETPEIKQEEQLIGFENEQDEGHVESIVEFEPIDETIQTEEGEHQRKEESIEDTQNQIIEVQVKSEEPLELIDDPSFNNEGVDVLNELLEDDSGDEGDNQDINPEYLEEAGNLLLFVIVEHM